MINGQIYYGEIILPDDIHIAAGTQCSLWWSTMAVYEEGDRSVYFDVTCDIGRTTSRAFVIDAEKQDAGTHLLTVKARDLRTRRIISERTVYVHISEAEPAAGNKSLLMIGDSRTWHSVGGVNGRECTEGDGKTVSTELYRLLNNGSDTCFRMVGSYVSRNDCRVRNLAENGWTYGAAADALEKAGGVRTYCEANGLDKDDFPDYVTVMFGCNDLNVPGANSFENRAAKIDGITESAKRLVSMLLEAYPETTVLIVLEPSGSATQDGFGYWGGGSNTNMTECEYSIKALRKRIITEFDSGRFDSRVRISSAGLWCDRMYGFPYLTVSPSSRATDPSVLRQINNVHPHDCGYRQIADGIFGSVCCMESEKKRPD